MIINVTSLDYITSMNNIKENLLKKTYTNMYLQVEQNPCGVAVGLCIDWI